jgi:SAM-dependent methyltransferase
MTTWPEWSCYADWAPVADATWYGESTAAAAIDDPRAMYGLCGLCGRRVIFIGDARAPSTREILACPHCSANVRQRAAATVLLSSLRAPLASVVYATEHASSFYVSLRLRVGRLHGSEYNVGLRRRLQMSTWLWRCRIPEFVRTQDVTALTFRDRSMDGVVCLDVLEHVPDYRAALCEFARVLKPGGTLVLTVPFYHQAPDSEQIAFDDAGGVVRHVGEPEYHGDPVRGGVLCYHHFGWDLLDAMRDVGFTEASACRVHDVAAGIPQGEWVLRGRR